MSSPFLDLVTQFEAVADDAQTFTFMSRAIELQERASQHVQDFLRRLETEKVTVVSDQDEGKANTILSMELALTTVWHELEMWMDLKRDRPDSAWGHLVDAQVCCSAAINVRRQLAARHSTDGLENLQRKLEVLEQLVFPPQVFTSIGGTTKVRECSICGNSYDDCSHIKLRAYMGSLCHVIIRDVRLREISLVPDPANKHCRVTHFSDSGKRRNKMTWRLED